jgi:sporulation protein YlmC with PRC-barrel domain
MEYRISDLRYKEVISIKSGQRFGYVYDAIVDIENCKLIALVVPAPIVFSAWSDGRRIHLSLQLHCPNQR